MLLYREAHDASFCISLICYRRFYRHVRFSLPFATISGRTDIGIFLIASSVSLLLSGLSFLPVAMICSSERHIDFMFSFLLLTISSIFLIMLYKDFHHYFSIRLTDNSWVMKMKMKNPRLLRIFTVNFLGRNAYIKYVKAIIFHFLKRI